MKRIISIIICLCMLLSVAPVTIFAADETEITDKLLTGGTLLSDYTLNKAFAETPIGKYVISDRFTEGDVYDAIYDDKGVTVVKTADTASESTQVSKFAINFTAPFETDEANNAIVYQQGFAGIYAIELTFNANLTAASNSRSDFYFSDVLDGSAVTNNNLRIQTNGSLQQFDNESGSAQRKYSYSNWEAGEDKTIRVVVDTKNGVMYGFDVDTSTTPYTYTRKGQSTYSPKAEHTITSILFSPRYYLTKGASITFKNVKVYEISRNEGASGNIALTSFANALPAGIVNDPANVKESFELPSTLKEVGTVTTSDSAIVTDDGVVTRGFEEQKATVEVNSSAAGMTFRKVYNLVVKPREDLDVKNLADYNYKTDADTAEFVYSGDNVLTADGYKAVKTYGTDSQTIGMLKTEKDSGAYSDTYAYDHTGAYDYEIKVVPSLTSGKAYVEIGNYNSSTGNFIGFGKFNITPSGVFYPSGTEDETIINEDTTGNEYTLKFRVDQGAKKYWMWANDTIAQKLPFTYTSSKNILNAYRISFDDAATDGDSVTLVSGNLTQQVYTAYTPVTNALSVADSIDVYDITNPADACGDINLPTADGYNIVWTADSALVDLENKKVYRTSADNDITLTATITSVSNPEVKVVKDFHIVVKAASDSAELLEGALARFTADSLTNQNPDALIADLELPSLTEEGYAVSWESLNETVMSDDGKINRTTNISQDTQVGLKVTVSYNGEELSKTINFTVAKRGADVALNYGEIPEAVENVVTYQAKVANRNGTVYLKDDIGNNIIGITIADSKLSFDYKGADGSVTNIDGSEFDLRVVMNSADKSASVFVNDILVADYVPYITNVTNFNTVVANGTSVTNDKVILDEYSLYDYNIKVYDYYDGLELPYVDKDLTLKTDSIGGVKVEWIPSAQSPVTSDGTYEQTSYIDFFDITLKLTMINGTDAVYEDEMEFVAVPSEDENVMKNATISTDANEDVTNNKSKAIDENFTTYYVATGVSEAKYVTIDLGSLMDISALYFFQSAEDGGMLSCDIYLSEDGIVWTETPVASPVFTDLKSNLVAFGTNSARYVKLTNISATEKSFKLRELKGYIIYASDDKAYLDILALTLPTDRTLTATSLTLPSVGSVYGSTLVWQTTDPSIIGLDGTINPPASKTEVVLTVTATYEGKTSVKTYTYYFPGTDTSGGGAGGAGGGGIGGPAGVNAGGPSISALPENPDYVQIPSEENVAKPVEESTDTQFGDVKTTDWFCEYLLKLAEAEIINGYDDGNFYPNDLVTREQFIKMLVIAANIELSETTEGFTDVTAEDWFAPYVYTAKEQGIANGIYETTFGVGRAILRQDMAVMIYNYLDTDIDITGKTELFADDDKIVDYAYKPVYAMKILGLINGYETGEFNPSGHLTRAEAAKIIYMVMEYIKQEVLNP